MGTIMKMGGAVVLAALSFNFASAQTAPDLSIARSTSATIYAGAYTTVTITVKNVGTAPAPSANFTYAPAKPEPSLITAGYVVAPILHGHSGRGGGYTTVGYTYTESPAVPLAVGASRVVKFNVIYPLGTINESWTANAGTATQLNLVSHTVTDSVASVYPLVPSAPTAVAVKETPSTDAITVTWHAPTVAGAAVTKTTVTATPVVGPGTTVLTGVVAGLGTSVSISGVAPSTSYSIVAQSTDTAGTGPASSPVIFATEAAHIVPGVPVIGNVWWISTTELACSWTPPTSGDSPIDDYQVSVKDGNGVVTTTDTGTGTEGVSTVDPNGDPWVVSVRAHNAAGWSAWSKAVTVAGG